jgi:hypothetical protein
MNLAHIYVTQERRRLYEKGFTLIMALLHRLTGKEITWQHLNQHGFIGITVDQDGKQLGGKSITSISEDGLILIGKGFGRYLASIDELRRDYVFQLRSTIKLCLAHWIRGLDKASGSESHHPNSPGGRGMALTTAPNWDAYHEQATWMYRKLFASCSLHVPILTSI